MLDRETCRRARLARDPRFDGRFFIGVKSTGIFCRPICPAPSPKEINVNYFPSAAAAAETGLRPCLRCRPECSPGTPAWNGSSVTVSRALRCIAEGGLDESSVDALADRLGMTGRHLRRLFVEHLGASPVTVAQTQRLLAAKKLVDETDLPLTTIAEAAGYGSIRRFNASFLSTYGRSPRELRKLRQESAGTGPQTFTLRARPPIQWEALLEFMRGRAIRGVEFVDENSYSRIIQVSGRQGSFRIVAGAKPGEFRLTVDHPNATDLLRIVTRVRRMFDLDADPMTIEHQLERDPFLANLIEARPGLRIPGAWDGFEIGVRAILGQQVSVAAASTLASRLVAKFGTALSSPQGPLTHVFPEASTLADSDAASIGLPEKRAEAIRQFAAAVATGALQFDGIVDVNEFQTKLCEIPGIGPWTAQYLRLRALSDPDAFPAGDLVLVRASGAKNERELERMSQRWSPWRAYAALHIWQGVRDGRIGALHVDGKPRRKAVASGG